MSWITPVNGVGRDAYAGLKQRRTNDSHVSRSATTCTGCTATDASAVRPPKPSGSSTRSGCCGLHPAPNLREPAWSGRGLCSQPPLATSLAEIPFRPSVGYGKAAGSDEDHTGVGQRDRGPIGTRTEADHECQHDDSDQLGDKGGETSHLSNSAAAVLARCVIPAALPIV